MIASALLALALGAAAQAVPVGPRPPGWNQRHSADLTDSVYFLPMGHTFVVPAPPHAGAGDGVPTGPYFIDGRSQIGLERPGAAPAARAASHRGPRPPRSLANARYGPQGPPKAPRPEEARRAAIR